MTHDPLCPWDEASGSSEGLSKYACECTLIARVRENERANAKWVPKTVADEMYAKGRADALAEAREAVAALMHDGFCPARFDRPGPCNCLVVDALAAIDALRGES